MGMFGSIDTLLKSEATQVKCLRLLISLLRKIKLSQLHKRHGGMGVFRCQYMLINGERALIERFSLCVTPTLSIEERQTS